EHSQKKDDWSQEEYQFLVKAVTMYPAGTSNRWDVIANFINKHSSTQPENQKSGKEVISKVKSMQKFDSKEDQTGDSFASFNQIHAKKSATSTNLIR
ncbi:SANT/Myb-like DNA-binding domain-containing protein, partial [Salmonella sp. s51228]|uniref:SANT/Myb-like DNA-binding domain-containing protein n=1 Tax=Salmonella sp. s51228 TaxID=3159652 RepID=UPI003981876A